MGRALRHIERSLVVEDGRFKLLLTAQGKRVEVSSWVSIYVSYNSRNNLKSSTTTSTHINNVCTFITIPTSKIQLEPSGVDLAQPPLARQERAREASGQPRPMRLVGRQPCRFGQCGCCRAAALAKGRARIFLPSQSAVPPSAKLSHCTPHWESQDSAPGLGVDGRGGRLGKGRGHVIGGGTEPCLETWGLGFVQRLDHDKKTRILKLTSSCPLLDFLTYTLILMIESSMDLHVNHSQFLSPFSTLKRASRYHLGCRISHALSPTLMIHSTMSFPYVLPR